MPITTEEQFNFNKAPRTEQYFDQSLPSFKIYAQPLDMPVDTSDYFKLQLQKQKSAERWQALSQLANAGVQVYTKIKAENDRKQELQGWLKASSGGQLDDNASKALANGYYKYTAMIDAATYNSNVQQFFLENKAKWNSAEEAKSALEDFNNKWLQERPTNDTYLQEMLPKILNTQTALLDVWTKEKDDQIQQEIYATALTGIQQQADNTLAAGVKKFLGLSSVDTLNSSELAIEGIESEDLNKFLRWGLTEAQEQAKGLGLSRSKASEIFIKRIGDFAVKYGLPELLDFTNVKDESGIALNQTELSEVIDEYKAKAERVRSAKIETYNKNKAELEKKNVDLFYKDLYSSITNYSKQMLTDPVKAKADFVNFWENIEKDPRLKELNKTDYKEIINLTNDIIYNPHTFATVDNDVTVRDLDDALYKGTLTTKDLVKALNDRSITLGTYKEYASKLDSKNSLKQKVITDVLNAKKLGEAIVKGASEEEWSQLLEDPNASADLIMNYSKLLAEQQKQVAAEKKAKATEAERKAEAAKTEQMQSNFLKIRADIAKGNLPSIDDITNMYTNGDLFANDTNKLIELVLSKQKEIEAEQKTEEANRAKASEEATAKQQQLNYLKLKADIEKGNLPSSDDLVAMAAKGDLSVNDASKLITMVASYQKQTTAEKEAKVKAAEREAKANKLQQQKLNYLQLKSEIAKSNIPTIDDVVRMGADGTLDVNDAISLASSLSSTFNTWEKTVGSRLTKLKDAAITKYSGSSFLPEFKGDISYEMKKYAEDLEKNFYANNDLSDPNILQLYKEQVLKPLDDFGKQLVSPEAQIKSFREKYGISSSTSENNSANTANNANTTNNTNPNANTTNTGANEIDNLLEDYKPAGVIEKTKAIFSELFGWWGKDNNSDQQANTTTLQKQDAIELLQLETGVPKETAEATTYQQAVIFAKKYLSKAADKNRAPYMLMLELRKKGFSEEEATAIIQEAIVK